MGLTHIPVTVSNFVTNESFTATFLIDTGATDSMAPAAALKKIGIEPVTRRAYTLANGQSEVYELGDARLSFLEDTIAARLIFGPEGSEPILGVIALESIGLIVDPLNQKLRKISEFSMKTVRQVA